jgi:hypothetical protein
VGDYNAEIYVCPCCGKNVLHGFQNHIIGFADYGVGTVKIIECPVCFEKYYSHTSNMEYAIFLDSVKKGTNKHYK